jgi:hypothetical protein
MLADQDESLLHPIPPLSQGMSGSFITTSGDKALQGKSNILLRPLVFDTF